MQEYFQTVREPGVEVPEKKPKPQRQRKRPRPYMQQLSAWEEPASDKNISTKKANDNFATMSTREKIHYLLNRPQFIPTLTCRIQTTDGHYYGKITNFKDDIVFLRLHQSRAVKRIAHETIEDIHLIGF